MDNEMDSCTVGIAMQWECHKTFYTPNKSLVKFSNLDERDQQLVKLRTDIHGDINDICLYHRQYLLDYFETYQKVCCNPFKTHKRSFRGWI